jgi:hypothetical protein
MTDMSIKLLKTVACGGFSSPGLPNACASKLYLCKSTLPFLKPWGPKPHSYRKHISYSWPMSWIIESQSLYIPQWNSLKGSSRSKFLPPLGSYSTSEHWFLNRVISRMFHEYIDILMKIFLDDFIVFSDSSNHLDMLPKKNLSVKFGINLNWDKCAFMVFSRTILGFIVSKEGEIMDPKKVKSLVNMLVPTTPPSQHIQVFNGMAQFYKCFIKNFASIMSLIIELLKKSKVLEWTI